MHPSSSLKIRAVIFAVLWIGFMLWWSGSAGRVNVMTLTLCGALVGYGWYRTMRWQLSRGRIPAQDPRVG
jgi:hypothetical protein